MLSMTTRQPIPLNSDARSRRFLLWIDGVGCWMVYSGGRVTIGGPVEPGSSSPAADICLLADLSRQHAAIERVGESYRLEATQARVNRQSVRGETYLRDGETIELGNSLTIPFRTPSVLTATAVLGGGSALPWRMFRQRGTPGIVDGIVLMDEVCLLGPGSDAHIVCRDWPETVILFRREGALWCRTKAEANVDSGRLMDAAALYDGAVVSGPGWRFRVEAVDHQ